MNVEYLRCGQVARLNVASILDWDECINYNSLCEFDHWAWDEVILKSWSDGGAGGQFGYLDGNGNFVESSNINQIGYYKASDLNPRTVHITLTVDDKAIWGPASDDLETINPADESNLTVWEFTITDNGGLQGWRPERDSTLSFTATIAPQTDHKNPPNSMARFITFSLSSLGLAPSTSQEPGYCLNATRERNPPQWDDTYPDDIDLKFPQPKQALVSLPTGRMETNSTLVTLRL